MRAPHVQRRQGGFTLVELMVVVAIIALLSAFLYSVQGRTYGANASNVSEQVASMVNLAKLRSVSTRKIHLLQVQPNQVTLWQSTTSGFATPGAYALAQTMKLPAGISIYEVDANVVTSTGAAPAANAALDYQMLFKPDGSSTGGTIYLTDQKPQQFRVLVYKATGGVRVRETW